MNNCYDVILRFCLTHNRGRRSRNGYLKQQLKRFVYSKSFWDQYKKELVCRSSHEDVLTFAVSLYNDLLLSEIPDVEKGQVLSNPYGSGTPVYPL